MYAMPHIDQAVMCRHVSSLHVKTPGADHTPVTDHMLLAAVSVGILILLKSLLLVHETPPNAAFSQRPSASGLAARVIGWSDNPIL